MFPTSRIAKDALGIAALLVAAALIGRHCYTRLMLPEAPRDPVHTALADFRDVIVYPTRAVLAGVNPYVSHENDPDSYRGRFPVGNNFPVYSPLIFVPALPFAVLPLWTSALLWWVLNITLTVMLAYVAWRWCGLIPSIAMTTTLAAAILLSRPGHANIYFGQATLFFVLASVAALNWARRKPYLAAIALAMATIKPTFGGPLAILLFCRRDWKAAIRGSMLGIAAAAIGLAIIFSHDTPGNSVLAVLRDNQQMTERDPAVDPVLSNSRIDAVLVVDRLLGPAASTIVRIAVPLLVLGITGLVLLRAARRAESGEAGNREPFEKLSTALILVSVAACVYHNIYDALLLVVPAAVACPWFGRRGIASAQWMGLLVCALLVVPAFSYFSSQQFNQLLARAFPSVLSGVWSPGHTPLPIQLANGCAVIGAWLLLLVATWRASNLSAPRTVNRKETLTGNRQPQEAIALATSEFRAAMGADARQHLVSQRNAAPLPISILQGVRQ